MVTACNRACDLQLLRFAASVFERARTKERHGRIVWFGFHNTPSARYAGLKIALRRNGLEMHL